MLAPKTFAVMLSHYGQNAKTIALAVAVYASIFMEAADSGIVLARTIRNRY